MDVTDFAREIWAGDNLYGEVVLYQGVGDNVKALERMNVAQQIAGAQGAASIGGPEFQRQ